MRECRVRDSDGGRGRTHIVVKDECPDEDEAYRAEEDDCRNHSYRLEHLRGGVPSE